MRIIRPRQKIERYVTLKRKNYVCPDCLTWIVRDRQNDRYMCMQCGRNESREEFTVTLRSNQLESLYGDLTKRMIEKRKMIVDTNVVYYIRFGNRVKIGTSYKLSQRLIDLPWDEVLLTEPGGYKLENQRHLQFSHLHAQGEWFDLGDDLAEFIEARKEELSEHNADFWDEMPEFPWSHGARIQKHVPRSDGEDGFLLEWYMEKFGDTPLG